MQRPQANMLNQMQIYDIKNQKQGSVENPIPNGQNKMMSTTKCNFDDFEVRPKSSLSQQFNSNEANLEGNTNNATNK